MVDHKAMGNIELRNPSAIPQIERILKRWIVIDEHVKNVRTIIDRFRPGVRDLELVSPAEPFVHFGGKSVVVGTAGAFYDSHRVESRVDSIAATPSRSIGGLENTRELGY